MADHYAILGIGPGASAAEVRQAYLRLARERHPDRYTDPRAKAEAGEFFKHLTEAYNTLGNERTRREYDALRERPQPRGAQEMARDAFARGQALGVTMSLPTEDRFMMSRGQLMAQLAMMLGGRAAERVTFDEITTGASNDLERVTQTARQMVTRFGMSEKLGPLAYGKKEGEVFLGRSITKQVNMSEQTMQKVDREVRRIIDEQYAAARRLIEENKDKMHAMAKALLEWETIDSEQIDDIMAGKPPRPPKDWMPSASKSTPPTPPVSPGGAAATTA